MSAQLLYGSNLAAEYIDRLKKDIEKIRLDYGKAPSIASIAAGDHPDAAWYMQSQKKIARVLGIEHHIMQAGPKDDLHKIIDAANKGNYHGIILNKPIPGGYANFADDINPDKDVEGLGSVNLGRFYSGKMDAFRPCTPNAALQLIKSTKVNLRGKEAVIIGRSEIVGRPMAELLLRMDMTVTICHSKTNDLAEHVGRADVVVAAVGQKYFIKGEWLKREGRSIVVDIGINDDNGKIVGDVDFESCRQRCSYITPVPGGVGPVTPVMLAENAVQAFKQQLN